MDTGTDQRASQLRDSAAHTSARSDAELLSGCRAGDAAAWGDLVRRYERLVFSVALRNGLSRPDAADVTQSTFLALLEALDSIRDEQRLSYWLMTVARRKAWRLRARSAREVPNGIDDVSDGTLDRVGRWEREADLYDAMVTLGSPCNELLHGLYLDPEEPSYAMLARRFGRSIGSIGPMRGRCLQRLRSLLGEDAR